jgi:hypothetical protein
MKGINEQSELIARRGELLAELFLQELNPFFVARNTAQDFGIDFFVGFRNPRGGINLVAIEVKVTERPVKGSFWLQRRVHEILANSNIPGLLLVIDVKENRYFYAQLGRVGTDVQGDFVAIELSEVDRSTRGALADRFSG